MIQQLLELSMPTNFSVFWVYPASQRAGGWPAAYAERGSKLYVQQAMLTFCQHNEFRKTVLLTFQYFGHILHPSEVGRPAGRRVQTMCSTGNTNILSPQ